MAGSRDATPGGPTWKLRWHFDELSRQSRNQKTTRQGHTEEALQRQICPSWFKVSRKLHYLLLTKGGTWIFGPSFKLSKSLQTCKIKIEWFMTNLLCFFKVSMVQPWPLYPAPDLHGGFRCLIRLHAPQEVHVQVLGTLTYSWNRSFLQNVSERLELTTCLF